MRGPQPGRCQGPRTGKNGPGNDGLGAGARAKIRVHESRLQQSSPTVHNSFV